MPPHRYRRSAHGLKGRASRRRRRPRIDLTELERIEQALAALEAQRFLLGDKVVDTAIAPLQEKLAALRTAGEGQRKQVTVLFARLTGLGPLEDPAAVEEVNLFFSWLWPRLDAIVTGLGGTVDKHVGARLMALFGTPVAHEDDARRAVRAALQMRRLVANLGRDALPAALAERGLELRAGLNTGPVLAGPLGRTGEVTVVGDAVNVASRLEEAAAPGAILASHDTYRHVRGYFDVSSMPPLFVKGKSEAIRTYRVLVEKPRVFPVEPQAVAGQESPTIGREGEIATLQAAFEEALAGNSPRVVTIVGGPGVGKTRLVYDLQNWVELLERRFWLFRGQAEAQSANLPYALVRNMLSFRFQILESDSPEIARTKLEQGIATFIGERAAETAHLIGHLVGFDFSDSPYLRGILDDAPQIRGRAFHTFAQFLHSMSAVQPVVLLMENMQWVDAGSIALAEYLWQNCAGCPLFILATARPEFLERWPGWAPPPGTDDRRKVLSVGPLTVEESRRLLQAILRPLPEVPPVLEELIIDKAGGNPFYLEEMVRMLVDDGVLVPAGASWQVHLERLVPNRVPPTLTGVLQARLDGLTAAERDVLQRAAVVGEQFWDAAVAALRAPAGDRTDELAAVQALLQQLAGKEMVVRQEKSAFAGTTAYHFRQAVLHDVTYESVLLRRRRLYHGAVAGWLVAQAGQRVEEYAGLIARHHERAGALQEAARWYQRAAQQARTSFLPAEAIAYYRKALTFLGGDGEDRALRVLVYQGLGDMYWRQAQRAEAVAAYQAMREVASAAGDRLAEARACNHLARAYRYLGQMREGMACAQEAEALAQRLGPAGAVDLARAVAVQGWIHHGLGQPAQAIAPAERALALAKEAGAPREIALALNLLGVAHTSLGEHERGARYAEEALELYRTLGNRWGVGIISNNLGENARARGDYAAALRYYEDALAIAAETGNRESAISCFNNIGGARLALGQPDAAEAALQEALARVGERGWFGLSETYRYLAAACLAQDRPGEALAAAQRALALALERGQQDFCGAAWRMLGRVAAATGEAIAPGPEEPPLSAVACFERSAALFAAAGMSAELAQTQYAWGAAVQQSDPEAAARLQAEALRQCAALGLPPDVAKMGV